nr:hypothetical protein CFP56_04361 [Quercus suber]
MRWSDAENSIRLFRCVPAQGPRRRGTPRARDPAVFDCFRRCSAVRTVLNCIVHILLRNSTVLMHMRSFRSRQELGARALARRGCPVVMPDGLAEEQLATFIHRLLHVRAQYERIRAVTAGRRQEPGQLYDSARDVYSLRDARMMQDTEEAEGRNRTRTRTRSLPGQI